MPHRKGDVLEPSRKPLRQHLLLPLEVHHLALVQHLGVAGLPLRLAVACHRGAVLLRPSSGPHGLVKVGDAARRRAGRSQAAEEREVPLHLAPHSDGRAGVQREAVLPPDGVSNAP